MQLPAEKGSVLLFFVFLKGFSVPSQKVFGSLGPSGRFALNPCFLFVIPNTFLPKYAV